MLFFECGIEAEAKIEAGLFDKSFDWDPKPLYLLGPVELGSYPIFAGVNGGSSTFSSCWFRG